MTDPEIHQRTKALHYSALGQELWRRTRDPIGHPSFVIFFLLAVVGCAGLGLWIEVWAYFSSDQSGELDSVRTALTTYFPALAGSTVLQLIWAESSGRSLRAFALLCAFMIVLMTIVSSAGSKFDDGTAIWVGIVASIGAGWIWWITNADQQDFQDKIDPDAAIGGGRDRVESRQLSGSLDGFYH
jgi:hypothetical protein